MLEIFFALMAAGLNAAPVSPPTGSQGVAALPAPAPLVSDSTQADPSVQIAPGTVAIGQGVVIGGAPASPEPSFNMAAVPGGLVADPQTPAGKFTTAAEVKPILNATKANWVAVREFNGQDLVYITHLWSWRCGLKAIAISVNDEPMQNWPMPPCHEEFATPNAVLAEDGLPYLTMKLGGVQSVTVQIVYDDLSMDIARFDRGNVLIP